MRSNDHGVVLLAAGASTRLGQPKQLLDYRGKSLLRHAIDLATEIGAKPIVTVLGAHANQLISEAEQQGVTVLINNDWKEGMASSIRHGLTGLLQINPGVPAVIFMVCDQPFVTIDVLQNLLDEYTSTGKPMIACKYDGSIGTPALFDKTTFASLLQLKGDAGAKSILKARPDLVSTVRFPGGNIDIDTLADYENLVAENWQER